MPGLETADASLRHSTVTYPVHKSLQYVRDLKNIGSLTLASALKSLEHNRGTQLCKGVLDGAWSVEEPHANGYALTSPVNLRLAD